MLFFCYRNGNIRYTKSPILTSSAKKITLVRHACLCLFKSVKKLKSFIRIVFSVFLLTLRKLRTESTFNNLRSDQTGLHKICLANIFSFIGVTINVCVCVCVYEEYTIHKILRLDLENFNQPQHHLYLEPNFTKRQVLIHKVGFETLSTKSYFSRCEDTKACQWSFYP